MKTQFRPATLSSKSIRARLGHRTDAVFLDATAAIDQAAAIYDGLVGLKAAQNPMMTPEANAVQYAKAHEAGLAKVRDLASAKIDAIAAKIVDLEDAALKNAGLFDEPPGASEVRATLRAMTQKQRDAALADAAARGDKIVMGAVRHAPSPITTGPFTVPVSALMQDMIERENPDYRESVDDLQFAAQALSMAATSFTKAADEMRDTRAEQRAEVGSRAAAEAGGRLQAAMQGVIGE